MLRMVRFAFKLVGSAAIMFVVFGAFYELRFRLGCKEAGWPRDKALARAFEAVAVMYPNPPYSLVFKHVERDDLYTSGDWMFTLAAGKCEIAISVDHCGSTDDAGLSDGCPH